MAHYSKKELYCLARSLLKWDGFKFPPISQCTYWVGQCTQYLFFHIGDRGVTFSVYDGSRVRCVEENDGFGIRYEGTVQDGWTFSHRYDVP